MNTEPPGRRILLVEGDELVVHLVSRLLTRAGFEITATGTGAEGLALARSGDFQLVLLDADLPDLSGFDVLRRLRREGDSIPVLMLSDPHHTPRMPRALDEGADDYLPKPIDPRELPARVRALLRRSRLPSATERPRLLILDDLGFDQARRRVSGPRGDATLTATETALLRELLTGAGRIVATAELEERIWGLDPDTGSNVVAAHISRLRRKLHRVGTRARIRARRGIGYELVPQ